MLVTFLILGFRVSGGIQLSGNDSITGSETARLRYDSFYDSLKVRAGQMKLTQLLHNLIIRNPKTEKRTTFHTSEESQMSIYPVIPGKSFVISGSSGLMYLDRP